MKFVFAIALLLATSTYANVVPNTRPEPVPELAVPDTRPLPIPEQVIPDSRPLPIPEPEDNGAIPDTRPLPSPEDGDDVIVGLPAPHDRPVIEAANPCSACFEYITELVELLGNVVEAPSVESPAHPELPEIEINFPEINPHPLPVVPEEQTPENPELPQIDNPEVEIRPHPQPQPEEEIIPEIAVRPLPIAW